MHIILSADFLFFRNEPVNNSELGDRRRQRMVLKYSFLLIFAGIVFLQIFPARAQHTDLSQITGTSEATDTLGRNLPEIPEDLKGKILRGEVHLDQDLQTPGNLTPSEYADLVNRVEAVLRFREKHQGAQWWETVNVRWLLRDIQRWKHHTQQQQQEILRAYAALKNERRLYKEGKYEEAITLLVKASNSFKSILGEEHPIYAKSLNDLGVLYANQGLFSEAEALHQHALKIQVKILGPNHPQVGISLGNLSQQIRRLGRYEEAEEIQQRALVIHKQTRGPMHFDVARGLNNLAGI